MGFFMDLDDGDVGYAFDEFGVNSGGDPLMRVGEDLITNLRTGEVHFVDSWPAEPDGSGSDPLAEDDPLSVDDPESADEAEFRADMAFYDSMLSGGDSDF